MFMRRVAAAAASAATVLCAWSLAALVSAGSAPIPEQLTSSELWKLSGELVVPRGNASRSSAYQAGPLLLSYRTVLTGGHPLRTAIGGRRR